MKMYSKSVFSLVVTAAFACAMLQPAAAAEKVCPKVDSPPSGTIKAQGKTIGFIVGVRWGEGTLTLNDGSQHKFTLSGAKLIETGVATVAIEGEVYNLKRLEDFPGDYGAISGGLTIIKGIAGGAVLSNDHCVYISVKSETQGIRLSAPAPTGVLIKLVK